MQADAVSVLAAVGGCEMAARWVQKALASTPESRGRLRDLQGDPFFFKDDQLEDLYEICAEAVGKNPQLVRSFGPSHFPSLHHAEMHMASHAQHLGSFAWHLANSSGRP